MQNKSIWLNNIIHTPFKSVTEDLNVDILIIGGGITGLSTTYHLKDSHLKVCLVEQNKVAEGISSKTTGKLTYLQENIYTKLLSKDNPTLAHLYLDSQLEAIKTVDNIIKTNNIICNYKKTTSYLFTNKTSDIPKIKTEKAILESLNIKVQEHQNIPINIKVKYAISAPISAVFHPVKYILALKNIAIKSGIEIYEHSKITNIKHATKYICTVNNHVIIASKVILACHYPHFLFPLLLPLKTHLEKSYLTASPVKTTKPIQGITPTTPTLSVRYHDDLDKYIILLNNSHNLCHKYNYKKNLSKILSLTHSLNLTPSFIWSNHDIITPDSLPYIGYINKDLLIATGYNTWGMTNGSIAGVILSDLVQNKPNKYKSLFNPKRHSKSKNLITYLINIFNTTKTFIISKISPQKKWYQTNLKFEKRNGKNIAIYTDNHSQKHIVYTTCPHLKCGLIFNEIEKTWDCPCHGSRFSIDGKCLSVPALKDITYKNQIK